MWQDANSGNRDIYLFGMTIFLMRCVDALLLSLHLEEG